MLNWDPEERLVRRTGSAIVSKVPFAPLPCQSFNAELYCRHPSAKTTRKPWAAKYEGIDDGGNRSQLMSRVTTSLTNKSLSQKSKMDGCDKNSRRAEVGSYSAGGKLRSSSIRPRTLPSWGWESLIFFLSFFPFGLRMLVNRWELCISLQPYCAVSPPS